MKQHADYVRVHSLTYEQAEYVLQSKNINFNYIVCLAHGERLVTIGHMLQLIGDYFIGIQLEDEEYAISLKEHGVIRNAILCDGLWEALLRVKGIKIDSKDNQ